ncbi:MAG: hypothetical protein EXR81_02835 [Gammaproteobacteria bacterium]|nr:hypothetical protein [Gammaproteobacteria bacterium]
MTSLKKIATIALLVSAVSSTGAMADPAIGGLGIGPIIAVTPEATDGGVALTYFAPSYIASVTANYVDTTYNNFGAGNTNQSAFSFGGVLELRKPIASNLNFDYGIAAGEALVSNKTPGMVNPYFVGLTVGVDYQITPQLIGYANASPFSYVAGPFQDTTYAVLAQATLGVSYLI